MKTLYALIICLTALVLINLLRIVLPFFSFMIFPALIGGISWIIFTKCNFSYLLRFILIIFFIIVNDLVFRYYFEPTHDPEGVGWLMLFMIIDLMIISTLAIIFGINNHKFELFVGLAFAIFLVTTYLIFFWNFGQIWTKQASNNIEISKNENIFISELYFNDSLIISKMDTFKIANGWIEKEIEFNHRGIKEKRIETGKINAIIKINGKFDKYGYSENVYYNSDSNKSGKGQFKKYIMLESLPLNDTININFYDNHYNFIKSIKTVANIR